MTEALVAALAQIDGLQVISRTSTLRYKTEHATVPEIARTLGVTLVLEGSVMLAGEPPGVGLSQLEAAVGDYEAAFDRLERLAARGILPPAFAFDLLFDGLAASPVAGHPGRTAPAPARGDGDPLDVNRA
jgi:hypothetical protein